MAARLFQIGAAPGRRSPKTSEPPSFAASSTRIRRARSEPEQSEEEQSELLFAAFRSQHDAELVVDLGDAAREADTAAVSPSARPSEIPRLPISVRVLSGVPPLPLTVSRSAVTIRRFVPPPLPRAASAILLRRYPSLLSSAPSRYGQLVSVVLGAFLLGAWAWLGLDSPAHREALQAALHRYLNWR